MIRKMLAVASAVFFFNSFAAFAENISVDDVQVIGASKDQAAIVKSLIQNEVRATDGVKFVEKGGDGVLKSTLTKLDSSYVFQLSKVSADGATVSRQVKTQNFDEIDVAVKRVTEAVLQNMAVEDTAARGNVLNQEQKEVSRVKAVAGWEFGLGIGTAMTNAFTDTTVLYALGLGYVWDVKYFLLEIRGDFFGGFGDLDKSFSSIAIGGQYIWLDKRDYAIFSGAEFGFGRAVDKFDLFGDDNAKGGFYFAVDTGVLFLRSASVNLEARLHFGVIAAELNHHVPAVFGLLIGIHF